MPAAARLSDKAQISSDAHGCPGCPHPGTGPVVVGSPDTNINGLPAARKDDLGVHAVCCGPNIFQISKGSPTVYVNGKPLARMNDSTKHCGGNGNLIEGSPDVLVDDGADAMGLGSYSLHALSILLAQEAAFARRQAQEHSDSHDGGDGPGGAGGDSSSGGPGGGASGASGKGPRGDLGSDVAPSTARDQGGRTSTGAGSGSGTGSGNSGTGNGTQQGKPAGAGGTGGAGTSGATAGGGTAAAAGVHQISIALVNAGGAAQAALEFELVLPSGDKHAGKSDPAGAINLGDLSETGKAHLILPDIAKAPQAQPSLAGPLRYVDGGVDIEIDKPTTVELPPVVRRGRLTGMHFETAKTFLLPSAMAGIRMLVKLYDSYQGLAVLVDGHTDAQGSADYNRGLSTERAEAVAAYLTDDAQSWLKWYGGRPHSKKWGTREDKLMLSTVVDKSTGAAYYAGPIDGNSFSAIAAIKSFQHAHLLTEDGIAGHDTREALVQDYMVLEGTSIKAGAVAQHGCGQTHPLPETAGDGNPDQPKNRRVEVFLFEGQVAPPPQAVCPSGGCAEYQAWVDQTVLTVDLDAPAAAVTVNVHDDAGAAVADVDVHLSGPIPQDAKTGADGSAAFKELVPGDYKAIAEKEGFSAADGAGAAPAGGSATIELVLKPRLLDLEVIVTDEATPPQPLAGAAVALLDDAGKATVAGGTTDAKGVVRFPALPRGNYNLVAEKDDFKSVKRPLAHPRSAAIVQAPQGATAAGSAAAPAANEAKATANTQVVEVGLFTDQDPVWTTSSDGAEWGLDF